MQLFVFNYTYLIFASVDKLYSIQNKFLYETYIVQIHVMTGALYEYTAIANSS